MSEPAIHVENLGKKYVLAHQAAAGGRFRYERFSDKLIHAATAPLRWFGSKKEGASATREEFWALNDVSFTVQQGDAPRAIRGSRLWVSLSTPENVRIRVRGKLVHVPGRQPRVIIVTPTGWRPA